MIAKTHPPPRFDSPRRRRPRALISLRAGLSLLGLTAVLGCDDKPAEPSPTSQAEPLIALSAAPLPVPGSVEGVAAPPGPGTTDTRTQPHTPMCPAGMSSVPGGPFWVGTAGTRGLPDEHPRFLTRVPNLCVDRTEVTVEAFTRCVDAGQCAAQPRPRVTCNFGRPERAQHPMNCLDWQQAESYCRSRGARLPTEIEWEYFARGGAEYRTFSWGDAPPDGNTCWKRAFTCEVGSYPPGAFGLVDVTGNVWEWTSSFHGDYPWPARESPHKVYRGGGWSRRFDKWLQPTLRNRDVPDAMGSHLGLRCVTLPEGATCPYGDAPEQQPGSPTRACLGGVDDAECPKGKEWNGVRCARPGEPECPNGTRVEAGFGCQVPLSLIGAQRPSHSGPAPIEAPTGVTPTQSRTPKHDADCERFQAERPKAFRLEGGSHKDRNLFAAQRGCKNRDVGASWNSVCCP